MLFTLNIASSLSSGSWPSLLCEEQGCCACTGKMSFPRNVSPLAQKIRYDIENLFRHQYVHHPVYFRETDFKPGSFIYNNKERADEMLYFVKESGRLLDNILLKWKAEVHFSLLSTLFRSFRVGPQAECCTSLQRDYIKYQEWLGLHKLEVRSISFSIAQHKSFMFHLKICMSG